jgi:hypothetical protein
MQIPSRQDWGDFGDDLDARYAFKVFFEKSIPEAVPLFQENPIERTDELRFMPPVPFRYYILAFRDYVLSEESQDDSDAASCYLRLIEEKVVGQPDTIKSVMPDLIESVQKVAHAQSFYDADLHIYGDFKQISARIMAACEKDR